MIRFFLWLFLVIACFGVSWLSYIDGELFYLIMVPGGLICLIPMWEIARNPVIKFINIFLRMYYRFRWPEFYKAQDQECQTKTKSYDQAGKDGKKA